MAAPRRVAPAPPPPAVEGVNFGSLGFYSGGFTLPKGRYALEFATLMHAATKQDGTVLGKPRLGVMVYAHSIEADGSAAKGWDGTPFEQFVSMGSKADASFAPDPATGKGLIPVPGGPASTLPRNTNWQLFLKSLYDCGLPEGIFTNDLSVLDGVWVVTDQVPEPEERKGYGNQAATGEAAGEKQDERKGSGLIPTIAEILEGGKPWEGTGGLPTVGAAAPAAAAPKAVQNPIAGRAPVRSIAPMAPAAPATDISDDDVMLAATNGLTDVLTKAPQGTTKLLARTGTFKAVAAAAGDEMANAVLNTFFVSDEALNSVLGPLGYVVQGGSVKVA